MNKKNQSPVKWIVGIVLILAAVTYWTAQQTQSINQGKTSAASTIVSPNNFIQFLESVFGIHAQNNSSSRALNENNPSNQNTAGLGQLGNGPSMPQASLQGNNARNSSEASAGNNGKNNTSTNADQTSGNVSGVNPTNNSELNLTKDSENSAEYIPENNSEMNSEINADNNFNNNPGSDSENNAGTNSDQGTGDLSGNNAETNSDNTAGNNPSDIIGNSPGDNSGNNPGTGTDNNPGNNTGGSSTSSNQSDLPVINPIPSDGSVSQSITQQHQQSDALAALLAAHQALVVPVQQQAQASKYQTVSSQNIPPVSTNQAPADLQEKIKSNQVAITH